MALPLTPLTHGLETLPLEIQDTLFSYFTSGDLSAMRKTCKSYDQFISDARVRIPVCLQDMLAAYRSPEHKISRPQQVPGVLFQLDEHIRTLEERLSEIRVNQRAGLPYDLAEEITIKRALNDLGASRLPNDQFPRKIIDLIVDYYTGYPTLKTPCNVIGSNDWNTFIGQVPRSPLLSGTETLLRSPCSIFPGKTKDETHICVSIPSTVDGKPLTLKRIQDLAENSFGNQIRLHILWDRVLEALGDAPIAAGQYVLLKGCLPETKNKTHQELREVLERHPEYEKATLIQVLVASIMEYIRSGGAKTRLFQAEYARTSTTVDGWDLAFGGIGPLWPVVPRYRDDLDEVTRSFYGLAVVLRSGRGSPLPPS